jgi:hypothetical protein
MQWLSESARASSVNPCLADEPCGTVVENILYNLAG